MIPHHTNVIRSKRMQSVEVSNLVPGDIIQVKAGDKIPADGVVFSTHEFRVDNSSLTGESESLERAPALSGVPQNITPLEAKNLIFSGTIVSNGGFCLYTINTAKL
jgi:sodium/potassium-transporting ATPase subunit alpha